MSGDHKHMRLSKKLISELIKNKKELDLERAELDKTKQELALAFVELAVLRGSRARTFDALRNLGKVLEQK